MFDGAYAWACYLLLGLFGCGLVARAQDRVADTRSLLVPVLAVVPYALVIFWMAGDTSAVAARPWTAVLVGVLYLVVLSVRILRAAYGFTRVRAALVAMVLIIAAPWVLATLNLDTRLWVTDESQADDDSDDSTQAEPLLYEQPARIAAAVERVAPGEAGAPAVFYLGFAGDGDQSIFKREAVFAQSVFAAHFGSGERSVELINDVEDRDSYPLATVSGLTDALKLLAARMNPAQDVLVLMLTSHGSKEGLAVTNGMLPLLQLDPAQLRQALDEAGIQWRVLIVSACYSGVFLEPLKTDTT
ncbi:MAG: C13 family peptidase, partial [Steroidobacteraceae bacterium]